MAAIGNWAKRKFHDFAFSFVSPGSRFGKHPEMAQGLFNCKIDGRWARCRQSRGFRGWPRNSAGFLTTGNPGVFSIEAVLAEDPVLNLQISGWSMHQDVCPSDISRTG
jgi:hypothetical protein